MACIQTLNLTSGLEKKKPPEAAPPRNTEPQGGQILRFHKSERMLHWSIAIPFTICFLSALVLVLIYNPHPQRAFRQVFSWLHRVSGFCLILFPLLTAWRHRKDHKIHLYNIKEAWGWAAEDVKWLLLMGVAAIRRSTQLPPQGKFNAAEKLNFMMVMCACPLFIVTGISLSVFPVAFVSWVFHVAMAAVATPLMLGHIFMATINPETRVGLSGMISGYVDRHWARHHYARWYQEKFGKHGTDQSPEREVVPRKELPTQKARIQPPYREMAQCGSGAE